MECPIARAVDEVGDAWTLVILREAFKGAATFGDFEARLPITPTTLTRRLEALTSRGFFTRATYQTNPPRERYELTEKALDLLPILLALGTWGNRWLAPEGELLTIVDPASGDAMDVAVVDRKTSRPLRPGEVALKAGPGAKKRMRELLATPLVLGARSAQGTSGGDQDGTRRRASRR
ncbi:Transcriptional regulator, HxlR family protein [Minicystis rosea]|nr:Transcriptional regulator, HxlR family protein [Minicystis rosea]